MSASLKECTALCKKFKCDRKPPALKIKRQGSKKAIWCNWIDDECDGPWCKFGVCTVRKMTESGKCKATPHHAMPVTGQLKPTPETDFDMDEGVPKKYARELRGAS